MNVKCFNFNKVFMKLNLFFPKRFFSEVKSHPKSGGIRWYSELNSRDKHLFKCIDLNAICLRHSSSKSRSLINNESVNQKSVRKCLIASFGLKLEEVETIFENYPKFKNIFVNYLQNNISLIEKKQLSSPELATKRSWVLLTQKSTLSNGLQVLENYKLLDPIRDGKTYIFALFLTKKRFKSISKEIGKKDSKILSDFDERMDFFCHNLEINNQKFCSLVTKNVELLTKNMDHIKNVMQLLKDNNISNESLIKDHWIFKHNIELMEKRIEECKQNNRLITTWILRCPDKIWYPLLDRWKQNRETLGNRNNVRTFVNNILNCSDKDLDYMLLKNNRLLIIAPKKLDQMTKLIYKLGYTSSDIMRVPRILNYSLKRVIKRLTDERYLDKPDLDVILLSEKAHELSLQQSVENISCVVSESQITKSSTKLSQKTN